MHQFVFPSGTGPVDDVREDSPEHIYHQIGTSEVIRVSKKKTSLSPKRPSGNSVPEHHGKFDDFFV